MNYAQVFNGAIQRYPISEEDVRAEFPTTSFAHPFIAPDGYEPVLPADKPEIDPVFQRLIEAPPVFADGAWREVWYVDGRPIELVVQDMYALVQSSVQDMLDAKARERAYDSVLSAVTYVNSSTPKFAAEGRALLDWRDVCWAKCYEIMGAVQSGARAMPTLPQVLAEMPAFTWPV